MIHLHTLQEAIEILRRGGVGVLPTDTVYGLVARVTDRTAVSRLYALKHRERKPGTTMAANVEQLYELGIPAERIRAVEHVWPNPVSVILTLGNEFDYLHQGLGSVPIRIPSEERLRAMLERTGPLATSSANHPGAPSAATVDEAWAYFGDAVDFYVDGGDLSDRLPSTIVRLSETSMEVLREGAIDRRDLGL